ncbi:MAG TPA: hypothetical protein VFB20_15705 [Burkholderiales bacterium]|nr:hypothetical protein [Burkholderiales bacterium]
MDIQGTDQAARRDDLQAAAARIGLRQMAEQARVPAPELRPLSSVEELVELAHFACEAWHGMRDRLAYLLGVPEDETIPIATATMAAATGTADVLSELRRAKALAEEAGSLLGSLERLLGTAERAS